QLQAESDLILQRAVELATAMELAARDVQDLQQGSKTDQSLNKLQSPAQRPQGMFICFRCEGNHNSTTYRFMEAVCHSCKKKKKGHLARKCRNRVKQSTEAPTMHQPFRGTKSAQETHLFQGTELNGNPVVMKLDTGASVTVVNEETYRSLRLGPLKKTGVHLRTYTGEQIPVIGTVDTRASYRGREKVLPMLVVKGHGPSLLSCDWLQELSLDWREILKVEPGMNPSVQKILDTYTQVFQKGLGTLVGTTAKIYVDSGVKLKYFKPRPLPYTLRQKVETELQRLESEGIIESVSFSEWATPLVPVVKPDKSIQICGDYKITVNQASKLDNYPIPKTEDLLAVLGGDQKFTKLDMLQAYQQMILDKESRKFTTINTHKGLYQYTRLPYGVSSAPGIFQRTMEGLLQEIPLVVVRIDDILITGKDDAEHLKNLEAVLQKLSTTGLRLQLDKCCFLIPEVVYLGYKINEQGVHPVADKVTAIQQAPVPRNSTQLRAYLGMLNYYHRFLPNISTILEPLHELLRKTTTWKWGPKEEQAFQKSKALLHSANLSVHDATKELILSCDASPYGVGAVLSHKMEDGSDRPIGYACRSLTQAERGLFNENKSIPPMAAARIQRWALTLAAYQYTIIYKEGAKLANADVLSHLPLPETPATTPTVGDWVLLMEHQYKQEISRLGLDRIQHFPSCPEAALCPFFVRKNELSVEDGCILWGSRVVIPPPGQKRALAELHEGHPGSSCMKGLARSYLWWPKMDEDLEITVKNCHCQLHQQALVEVSLHPWECPERPWTRLHLDFLGPFIGKMFLILVNAHSKWIDVHLMTSITSTSTIHKLRQIFATHGLPLIVVTDNGPSFVSGEFENFLKKNGIKHVRTSPYHPASNGLAERAVRTFKEGGGVRKIMGGNLETKVAQFLLKYRTTPQTTTGISPAQLLMGQQLRTHLDLMHPNLANKMVQKQAKQKERHDAHARSREFAPSDRVYVRNFQTWIPGVLLQQIGPVSWTVQTKDGHVLRRHQDHVWIWSEEESPDVTLSLVPLEKSMSAPKLEDPIPTATPTSP
uniref:Gypsy retrotransposon integrase-like protein 1 n=1 Tax=Latimeria chalumnae TaxID=7897 RepID=H3A251_LATCH